MPLNCHDQTIHLDMVSREQWAHVDASFRVTGASPSDPLRMWNQSNRRFWTSAILSIFSKSMPVSIDFALINPPFGVAPLLNRFYALWWLFSTTILINYIASSSNLLMKVPPLAASKRYLSCGPNPIIKYLCKLMVRHSMVRTLLSEVSKSLPSFMKCFTWSKWWILSLTLKTNL